MARPTASISAQITTNNTTQTPPATARAMIVFLAGNPASGTTTFTHAMTGVTFGSKALTGPDQNRTSVASHMCTFSLFDYAQFRGRSSDTLSFSGGTMGTTTAGTYRAYVVWLLHPTHSVASSGASAGAAQSVGNGATLSVTATVGVGVDAILLTGLRCNTSTIGLVASLAGQSHLTDTAFQFGHVKIDQENTTGNQAEGFTNNSGAPLTFAESGYGAKEGTPIPKFQGGRLWVFG